MREASKLQTPWLRQHYLSLHMNTSTRQAFSSPLSCAVYIHHSQSVLSVTPLLSESGVCCKRRTVFLFVLHTAQCSQKHSWVLLTTMLLTVSLYIALLASAGLHSFLPCVVLSVKHVWPQTKTLVYLISFSRVSFRIWGLCLRGVSDLPLAPPQSLIFSSILLSFLCFSSISFIVFFLEQSLEIFKYLSTLHLFSGVATVPQRKNMPLISSKCGKQEYDPILTGSVPPDLKYIYNPSIQNNRLTSELGKSERTHWW